eukprot:c10503_g1_i1 orf=196-429(-)
MQTMHAHVHLKPHTKAQKKAIICDKSKIAPYDLGTMPASRGVHESFKCQTLKTGKLHHWILLKSKYLLVKNHNQSIC